MTENTTVKTVKACEKCGKDLPDWKIERGKWNKCRCPNCIDDGHWLCFRCEESMEGCYNYHCC